MPVGINNNNHQAPKASNDGCCADGCCSALVKPAKWCCWTIKELFAPTDSTRPNCCANFASRITLFVIAMAIFVPCGVLALLGLPFSACCKKSSDDPTTGATDRVAGSILKRPKARPAPTAISQNNPSSQVTKADTLSGVPITNHDLNFSNDDEFLTQASIYLAEAKALNKKPVTLDLSRLGPDVEETTLINELLSEQRGLIIGHHPGMQSGRRFIMENIKYLAACGVKTIFIPGLENKYQETIDKYLSGEYDANHQYVQNVMSIASHYAMQNGLADLDYTDWAVVEAAKKHGIRVVAVDYDRQYQQTGARLAKLNFHAAKIIDRETAKYGPDDRFCVLIDVRHIAQQENDQHENLGLSEIFECPAITVRDNNRDPLVSTVVYGNLGTDHCLGPIHANLFCSTKV